MEAELSPTGMAPSHAAHAVVIALGLPSKAPYYYEKNSPPPPTVATAAAAAGCAFCKVGPAPACRLSLRTRSGCSSTACERKITPSRVCVAPCSRHFGRHHQHEVLRTPFSIGAGGGHSGLQGRGVSSPLQVGPFVVGAIATRAAAISASAEGTGGGRYYDENEEELDDDWGEQDESSTSGYGSRSRGRERKAGRSRRAPWEDIQWSNNAGPSPDDGSSRYRRTPLLDDDEEEEEVDDDAAADDDAGGELFDRDRPTRSARGGGGGGRGSRVTFDDIGEDDFELDDSRPPRRRRGSRDARPSPRGQSAAAWDAGWFQDAQRLDEGGMYGWVRNFYNSLFWYGRASEDSEQLPAMNFKDLLERFDDGASVQWSENMKAIVPPEELAAEQDYRWRPNGRRSAAYSDVGRGDAGRRRDQSRGRSSSSRQAERRRRRRERQPEWDEMEDDDRGGRARGRAGRGNAREIGEDNGAAIEQLRRKQRQLVDREIGFQADLEKVQERLLVVDATVELWLRRSAGMAAQGSKETDTEMLQAKRRIYGLKDEGRQLDSAKAELEGRLDDTRAKLDLVLQELYKLGEDPEIYDVYGPDVEMQQETTDTGEEAFAQAFGDNSINSLDGLEKLRRPDEEAVPVPVDEEAESGQMQRGV